MMGIVIGLLMLMLLPLKVMAVDLTEGARKDYFFQLDKYREEYRVFDLKRTQYNNLQTFATQEELVKVAKTMLLRRAEVWWTYFQYLRLNLIGLDSIEAEQRDKLTSELEEWQVSLKTHEEQIELKLAKDEVLQETSNLDNQSGALMADSYESLSWILWGRLNGIREREKSLSERIKAAIEVQIRDQEIRQTRLRGFGEVDRSLNLAEETLNTVKERDFNFADSYSVNNVYKKVTENLSPAYIQLTRVNQLLRELSKGIEL